MPAITCGWSWMGWARWRRRLREVARATALLVENRPLVAAIFHERNAAIFSKFRQPPCGIERLVARRLQDHPVTNLADPYFLACEAELSRQKHDLIVAVI